MFNNLSEFTILPLNDATGNITKLILAVKLLFTEKGDFYCFYPWRHLLTVDNFLSLDWLFAGMLSMSGKWVYDELKPPGEFQWANGDKFSTTSDLWAFNEPDEYLEGAFTYIKIWNGELYDNRCNTGWTSVCEVPEACYA